MSALSARLRPLAGLALALVAVAVLAGCVSEVEDGDKVIFTNAWWAPIFIMLLSIVCGLAGLAMLEGSGGIAVPLMLSCPVGVLVGLSLLTDRCEVDPAGFQGRMNFGSSAFAAQYDDIESIEMVTKQRRYSSFVQVVYYTRDGKRHEFSLSDQMAQTVGRQILSNARDHGIPAADNR